MARRGELSDRIIELYSQFFNALLNSHTDAWLNVELTMPQIKALLLVVGRGRVTGSQLARGLGIGLPSVTRFVDRLCEHGLIARSEDPDDRRVTYIVATAAGQALVDNLYAYRREYLNTFLGRLDSDELRDVERGVALLVTAATASAPDAAVNSGGRPSREPTERRLETSRDG